MKQIHLRTLLLLITSLTAVIAACALGQQLTRVQTYPEWSSGIRHMAVANDFMFAAMGEDGLFLFDTTNPAAPTKTDWETPMDVVVWTRVDDNYIYALSSYYTLRVVDISDLSNPVVLGSYKPGTPPIEADIRFPYAFLTTGAGGLHIIDISEPTTLKKIGDYNLTVNNLETDIWDVAVSGEYAYIVLSDPEGYSFVEVLDISNPASPIKVGSVRINSARRIVIKGNYAFVTNGRGLQILEVSNPYSPTVITSYDTPNFAQGLEVEGNYVYVNDLFGVEVVEISDIRSPRRVAYSKLPQVEDVVVIDGYIYVADSEKGLIIFEHP